MGSDPSSLERLIRRHHQRGELKEAATAAIEGFGPEVLGFLAAVMKDEPAAGEVFTQLCEELWARIGSFSGETSFRAWLYSLAWTGWQRLRREPNFRKTVSLPEHDESGAEPPFRTLELPRTGSALEEQAARLRKTLAPEDHALLILRIDRQMSWDDIAVAMLAPEDHRNREAVRQKTAELESRFLAVTDELQRLARKPV